MTESVRHMELVISFELSASRRQMRYYNRYSGADYYDSRNRLNVLDHTLRPRQRDNVCALPLLLKIAILQNI